MEMNSSSVRSEICRPDGAGELGGVRGYKDFAPDGAFGRSATVSAGPVAAGGGAEAVEIILRRGFGGGRAQAPAADPALRDTAALQQQRGCSVQPSVGETKERLRWVTNKNEKQLCLEQFGKLRREFSEAKGPQGPSERERVSPRVVAARRRIGCNAFSVENILGNATQGSSFLATLG